MPKTAVQPRGSERTRKPFSSVRTIDRPVAELPTSAGTSEASRVAASRSTGSSVLPAISPADAARPSSTTGSPAVAALGTSGSSANSLPSASTRNCRSPTFQIRIGMRSSSVTARVSGNSTPMRARATVGSRSSSASSGSVEMRKRFWPRAPAMAASTAAGSVQTGAVVSRTRA